MCVCSYSKEKDVGNVYQFSMKNSKMLEDNQEKTISLFQQKKYIFAQEMVRYRIKKVDEIPRLITCKIIFKMNKLYISSIASRILKEIVV